MPNRRETILTAALSVLCAVTIAVFASHASAAGNWAQAPTASQKSTITALKKGISLHRSKTWYWQDLSLRPRKRTAYQERKVHGVGYLQWMLRTWDRRRRAAKRYAQNPPHKPQWLCINSHEGSWRDVGYPYWGGLQMNRAFMAGYGREVVQRYGGVLKYAPDPLFNGRVTLQAFGGEANRWTPLEQMWVAERAFLSRGFNPWPKSARMCDLL
jgi:hypothetical protein